MATKTLLTVEAYEALHEPAGVRYELSEGELIVTPSANAFHNIFRDDFASDLRSFVRKHKLGVVITETDVKLKGETVRRPDVAFLRATKIARAQLYESPLPVAPDLVFEVVSPHHSAFDLLEKISQYLAAGAQAVWLLYLHRSLAVRHPSGEPGSLLPRLRSSSRIEEPELLPGYVFSLTEAVE